VVLSYGAFIADYTAILSVFLWVVLKPIIDILFVIFAIILGIIEALINPLLAPLRRRLRQRWITEYRDRWISKNVKMAAGAEQPSVDPDLVFATWLKSQKIDLKAVARQEIAIKKDLLTAVIQRVGGSLLTPLHSGIRVGIAPFSNYSISADLTIARPAMDQFGTGIAQLILRLRDVRGMEFVHFQALPAHLPIATHRQAGIARRFFHLDALIWGRYGDNDKEKASAFISAEYKREAPREHGLQYQEEFFPTQLPLGVSALSFSVNDPVGIYITLVLGLLKALRKRQESGARRWLRGWDSSRLSAGSAIRQIMVDLAFDVLPLMNNVRAPAAISSDVSATLSDMIGNWVGFKCSEFEQENWRDIGEKRFATQLYSILQTCAQLAPHKAVNFYRLGALSCLLAEKQRAITEMEHAGELDLLSDKPRHIGGGVQAEMALWTASRASQLEQRLGYARFAAHAASTIQTGSPDTIRQLLDSKIDGKGVWEPEIAFSLRWVKENAADLTPEAVALQVVEAMLSRSSACGSSRLSTCRRSKSSGRRFRCPQERGPGRRRWQAPRTRSGFLEPTVLADMTTDLRIMKKRLSIPSPRSTASITKTRVGMANDTEFGLAAFLQPLHRPHLARRRGPRRRHRRINEGIISTEIAFGGMKESGIGPSGGLLGLEIRHRGIPRSQIPLHGRHRPLT
jgi:hypothetical protein